MGFLLHAPLLLLQQLWSLAEAAALLYLIVIYPAPRKRGFYSYNTAGRLVMVVCIVFFPLTVLAGLIVFMKQISSKIIVAIW